MYSPKQLHFCILLFPLLRLETLSFDNWSERKGSYLVQMPISLLIVLRCLFNRLATSAFVKPELNSVAISTRSEVLILLYFSIQQIRVICCVENLNPPFKKKHYLC